MKKIILILLLAFAGGRLSAQLNVGSNAAPNGDAMLEITATNKGVLVPRVALTGTASAAPLSAHVAGMCVYNTATTGDVTPGFYINNGSKWISAGNKLTSVSLTSSSSPAGTNVGDMIYNTNPASGLPVGPAYWDGTQWVAVNTGNNTTITNVSLTNTTTPAGTAIGQMVYNTNPASGLPVGPVYWNGTSWQAVGGGKDLTSTSTPLTVTNGTGAVVQNVSVKLDSTKLGSWLTQSPMIDSLAKAIGKSPVKDSVQKYGSQITNINLTSTTTPAGTVIGQMVYNTNPASGLPVGPVYWNGTSWQTTGGGKDLTSTSTPLTVTNGIGAVVQNVSVQLDSTKLGSWLTQSPMIDSLAKAIGKSPVKDSVQKYGSQITNISLTNTTTPAGTAIGQMAYNTNAASGLPVGPMYWNGTNWVAVGSNTNVNEVLTNGTPTGTGVTATIYTDTASASPTLGNQYIWNGSAFVSYTAPNATAFYNQNTTNDAGSNKTTTVYRTGAVGIGSTTVPNTSAQLDVNSTTKGFLPPRMTQAQRNAIASPATGLVVYCSDCSPVCLYNNSGTPAVPNWVSLGCGAVTSNSPMTLNCAGATTTGSALSGTAVPVGDSIFLPYAYNAAGSGSVTISPISSTGVTGITATATSASSVISSGGGPIKLVLSGTPSAVGTASFAVTVLGSTTCTVTYPVSLGASLSTLNCAGVTRTGTLTAIVAASGVSASIPYTGGNGGAYLAQTVSSTGVTGLTATLAAGNVATGAGSLVYTISGTPASSGTASFAITVGGQSCSFTFTVAANGLPANITLTALNPYFIASVYDQDYTPYTTPSSLASLTTPVAADGVNEAKTVDVQGSITTTGITIPISYTVTGASVSLPAYSQTITVPAMYTQDGISRSLTFSYPAATLAVGSNTFNATVKAVGGTLNLKKLDIQTGIGSDNLGVLFGQFNYALSSSTYATLDMRDIAGIPDRNINDANHVMLYLPVTAPDGNVWLNNNLGADYSNTAKASFNPAQQATSSADYLAYGSLYQWGRYSDGHELMSWTSASAGSPVYTPVTGPASSVTPGTNVFYTTPGGPNYNWISGLDNTLWQGVTGTNNPCPIGFRLPTKTEFSNLLTTSAISNTATAASSSLKLSAAGDRSQNDGQAYAQGAGYYWSGSVGTTVPAYASGILIDSPMYDPYEHQRASGFSVRCIKN